MGFSTLDGLVMGTRAGSIDPGVLLQLLRDPRLSVATVAERLGYQTEAAFRRGFKRVHGVAPGQFRDAPRGAS